MNKFDINEEHINKQPEFINDSNNQTRLLLYLELVKVAYVMQQSAQGTIFVFICQPMCPLDESKISLQSLHCAVSPQSPDLKWTKPLSVIAVMYSLHMFVITVVPWQTYFVTRGIKWRLDLCFTSLRIGLLLVPLMPSIPKTHFLLLHVGPNLPLPYCNKAVKKDNKII